jgi:hypothetical protein
MIRPADGFIAQNPARGGAIAGMKQHWLTIGLYGAVAAYFGYKMMVRMGDLLRTDALFDLEYDKGFSGCILTSIAWLMLIGGVGTIIYACIQFAKSPN